MKQDKNANDAIVNFLLRINAEVKRVATKEAEKAERSLNWYVCNLIKEDLKQKGVL